MSECAVTGAREDLIYISPKSGRAVSRAAGEPWKNRLLPLPGFLAEGRDPGEAVGALELQQAFRLTGYFLERDIFGPRQLGLPEGRARFLACAFSS